MLEFLIAFYIFTGLMALVMLPIEIEQDGLLVKHVILAIIFLPYTLIVLVALLGVYVFNAASGRVTDSAMGKFLNKRIR